MRNPDSVYIVRDDTLVLPMRYRARCLDSDNVTQEAFGTNPVSALNALLLSIDVPEQRLAHYPKALGNLRFRRRISLKDAAERTSLSQSELRRIEHGQRKAEPEEILRLGRLLGINRADIDLEANRLLLPTPLFDRP